MAITFDAASSVQTVHLGEVGNSVSWSHTIGSGSNRILIVEPMAYIGPVAVTFTVTYNGVSLTKVGLAGSDADTWVIKCGVWMLKEANMPAAGTYTIQITASSSVSIEDLGGGATSWFGVDQTTAAHNYADATGNTDTPTLTITSATGEVVLDVMTYKAAYTATFNQTQRWDRTDPTGAIRGTAGQSAAGSASVVMSYYFGSANASEWHMAGCSLKDASGGPSVDQEAPAIQMLLASGGIVGVNHWWT